MDTKKLSAAIAKHFNLEKGEVESFLRSFDKKNIKKILPKKDHNAPKRNKSAYLFFCETTRGDIVKKSPEMKMTEVSKEMAKMWDSLNDTEKLPFKKKATADKIRYEQELAITRQITSDMSLSCTISCKN